MFAAIVWAAAAGRAASCGAVGLRFVRDGFQLSLDLQDILIPGFYSAVSRGRWRRLLEIELKLPQTITFVGLGLPRANFPAEGVHFREHRFHQNVPSG